MGVCHSIKKPKDNTSKGGKKYMKTEESYEAGKYNGVDAGNYEKNYCHTEEGHLDHNYELNDIGNKKKKILNLFNRKKNEKLVDNKEAPINVQNKGERYHEGNFKSY
jgi:hypothetical protein